MIRSSVAFDLGATSQLKRKINSRSPEMLAFRKRASQKYRSFLYHRFDKFSRGGGNWKQTNRNKQGRRNKRRGRFILRYSHTLYKSLSPIYRGLPGQLEQYQGDSMVVGIGGSSKHPSGNITVGELAAIHHFGLGVQDARKIVVRPDSKLRKVFVNDLRKALE